MLNKGVPKRVYELLGLGIPHHVQSFFTRLREDAIMRGVNTISISDVDRLYETGMLGPSGQSDLSHYENRLSEGLDEDTHKIALVILSEAAIEGSFDEHSRRDLASLYAPLIDEVETRITDALDVLLHDGYLQLQKDRYSFQSNLLNDWWKARYKGHYEPLGKRLGGSSNGG